MKESVILALICLAPVFAEDKTATAFRSTCFSNVCIGDDLDKVIQAQPRWATAHIKTSDDDQAVIHLRDLTDVRQRYVATISKSYHDLNPPDLERLADNFLDSGYTGEPAPYTRLLEPLARDKASFLVADAGVLLILKKAALCGSLAVHGVFVSDSGLYTGILMLPVGGKLTVVQMKRLFDLHIPVDASDAEKETVIFERVADLVKQIDAKYGTHWDTSESGSVQNESKAVGDDIEASLTLDRNSRGRRQREIEPMMTLSRRDFDTSVLPALAATAGGQSANTCEAKAKAVVID
jgi:hypothetical protein